MARERNTLYWSRSPSLDPQSYFRRPLYRTACQHLDKLESEDRVHTTAYTVSNVYPSSGVFDRDGGQTLYLFVDVKTDGLTTWPYVVQALQPLREKGWLSRVNGTSVIKGPITVVGTGT